MFFTGDPVKREKVRNEFYFPLTPPLTQKPTSLLVQNVGLGEGWEAGFTDSYVEHLIMSPHSTG